MDEYGEELETIVSHLASFEHASVRGRDSGRFVFATNGDRAVEVSRHHQGGWWVEFWEGEDVKQDTIFSLMEEATDAADKWLSGRQCER